VLGIEGLTPDIFLICAIITLTIILFLTEMVSVDVVAFLILVLLGVTNLVPAEILFSGFSSDAVVSLIGIMIISAGLERSGIANIISDFILSMGQDKDSRISLLLMSSAGILSGFMRSVGTVALFLPVITRIRRQTGIAKVRFLLPVGFCAILGGTLTMVGTGPLILLNSLLKSLGGLVNAQGEPVEQLGLFCVFPIGATLLVTGILYFLLLHRFVLPEIPAKRVLHHGVLEYFKRTYLVGGSFCELKVPITSPLCNNTLIQWEALLDPEIAVIGIKHGLLAQMPPLRTTEIKVGSIIAILGPEPKVRLFAQKYGLLFFNHLKSFKTDFNPAVGGLCEAVVPPSSQLVGREYKELRMRRGFNIQVLAVHRGEKTRRGQELADLTLKSGDTLGMICNWDALAQLESNPDFVVVTTDYPREQYDTEKAGVALGFCLLTIFLLIFSSIPATVCLLISAVGMIFSGVLTSDEAYTAISWKTVFLLAGLIPLGLAMQTTGAALWMTHYFLSVFEFMHPWAIEVILALSATLFSLVVSNVGATVILVPMAVQLAISTGSDPRMFALIVAISTSNSFILPTNQVNALISGPGRYKVNDFLKAGVGLSILSIIIVLVGLNLLFKYVYK